MKTTNRNYLLLAVATALSLSFGTAAYAEKGAETLMRLTKGAPVAKTATAVRVATHKCGNCTDSFVTVVDKATKGPNHAVTLVARHNCTACDTKIVTEGVGKAKKDVALHSCNAEVKPVCCAMN